MIRFSRYLWVYAFISAFFLVPGIVSLTVNGLRPSIDFSGGTLIELQTDDTVNQEDITAAAADGQLELSAIQKTGNNDYLLRTKENDEQKISGLVFSLNRESTTAATIVRRDTVGPVLGRELLVKAVIASVVAVFIILTYIAYAFKNLTYGIAAVIALLHDVVIIMGSFSLLGVFSGIEVDTLFITAVLTTMSFSVHDTIVVFDRIREYERKNSRSDFEDITDRALTETMGRSIANSVTIILMLTALVLISGDSIRWFAVALLIGTVSGTYSSPFVATPVLQILRRLKRK